MSVRIQTEPRHITRLHVQFAAGAEIYTQGVKIADVTSNDYTLDFTTFYNNLINIEITNPQSQSAKNIYFMMINGIMVARPAAYYASIVRALDGSRIDDTCICGAADPTAVTYSIDYL
jgi:hypothetical protein